ncbi:MAG: BtpA/SgcQ family protein [Planctomycetota bacterium]|nr:BtpA/SgcQ family protein [Planctomycetota bacterium]
MTPWTPRERTLVGMVHLDALPGCPRSRRGVAEIAERAAREARLLVDAGFDAVLVENMHDLPYLRREVGSEIVAAMSIAVRAVVEAARDRPVGVQVLAGANRAALSIAHATGARFIRAEGFAYAAVADEGLFDEADAGRLLRHRRSIGAGQVAVWADVRKKHSAHAITGDLVLTDLVDGYRFMGADGVVITGAHTGQAVSAHDLEVAAQASALPVVVGSGATPETLPGLLQHATAVIVGSALKVDGDWANELDPERVRAFVAART